MDTEATVQQAPSGEKLFHAIFFKKQMYEENVYL